MLPWRCGPVEGPRGWQVVLASGTRLLVVDGDRASARELLVGLTHHALHVEVAHTGGDALRLATEVDLVLMGPGLPDLEGAEVCRRLRARSTVPLIVRSDRSDELERVQLLELGADAYLVGPIGLRELVAHIRAVLRRCRTDGFGLLQVGRLHLDRHDHRVELDGRPLSLTPKELLVLTSLAEDHGRIVPRDELIRRVWQHQWDGAEHTLDVHIGSLRRKLGPDRWIHTVRGIGFRLQDPDRSVSDTGTWTN